MPEAISFMKDFFYAIRGMRKSPIFALTTVVVLALGIGANTAMFSVISAVLLKPLAYPDPNNLVRVSGGATIARFEELKTVAQSFAGIGAFTSQENMNLSGVTEPEALNGVRVSAGFLQILGVHPILGRGFLPAEDTAGGAPVALISAELWSRRFQRDPAIAGKIITLSAEPCTIIGVLPPSFEFPSPGIDVWLTKPTEWASMPAKSRELSPFLTLFGRIKPQVSLEQANAEMTVLHQRYAAAHPAMLDAKPKTPVELKPLKDQLVNDIRTMLWLLFGATSFVLLITCANVASILLARSSSRAREFAVRASLGASRGRLIRQLLAESLLLSVLGGFAGVALAMYSLRAIALLTALHLPRAAEIHLDSVVLLFAAALSICTGILCGLLPSRVAWRLDLMHVLRGAEAHGRRLRSFNSRGLLVVGQVALSVVLLIGAALLLESLARLRQSDVGFNPTNLLTVRISLPDSRYPTDQKKAAFFEQAVQQVSSAPGVRSAAAAMFLPMSGLIGSPVQDAAKPALRLNQRPIATIQVVSPAYFRTLAIPLRRGRDFSSQDRSGSERVAIIDEATARRFWPAYPAGQDPVGQRLLIGGANPKPAQIVGIVSSVHQTLENSTWPETVYVSFAQDPAPFGMLAIRTGGQPEQFISALRKQIRMVDPDQPIANVRTMDDLVDAAVGQRRLIAILLGCFAGVALLLALIGLYGLMAYAVTQRVREVGIRMALGAQRADILRLIMAEGLSLTLAGIILGIAGALALSGLVTKLLFHVSAADPLTYLGIALLFAAAAMAASYIPTRRALAIDPAAALRLN
jgi:predicted permease